MHIAIDYNCFCFPDVYQLVHLRIKMTWHVNAYYYIIVYFFPNVAIIRVRYINPVRNTGTNWHIGMRNLPIIICTIHNFHVYFP